MSLTTTERTVNEKSSFIYTCVLVDENDTPLDGTALTTLTLTLYDLLTMQVINSKDYLDVLNKNGVTVSSVGLLTWQASAEDNPIISTTLPLQGLETHIALFTWTWASGARSGNHELHLLVKNLGRVPSTDETSPTTPTKPPELVSGGETFVERLTNARNNYTRILEEITLKPKLDYSINGQSISWLAYQRFLLDAIKGLDDLLVAEEQKTPFEILSRGL